VRFLLAPKWLLSHLLVLALVVVLINLGFWQLRRLDQRRERNAVVEQALEQPPVDPRSLEPLEVVLARLRPVVATGRFTGESTLVANRTVDAIPGVWVVTALRLDDGTQLLVSRGFLPAAQPDPPPPSRDVRVEGFAIPRERLDRTARIDLDTRFSRRDVLPLLVQATSTTPADDADLVPVDPPELGEGPHFSYAMQWFIFSGIAVVGYPLVLRRIAQRRARDLPVRDDDFDRELAQLLRNEH
jgi:cytochrome oxidase assembly protein ShyY1